PKPNLAIFVYRAPDGDSLLSYRKYSRAVIVPKSGVGNAANFSCSILNFIFGLSDLRLRGVPELPPRASVRCGLKACSSFGTPSCAVRSSTASANRARPSPAVIPIQNTRGDFGVGKNP